MWVEQFKFKRWGMCLVYILLACAHRLTRAQIKAVRPYGFTTLD